MDNDEFEALMNDLSQMWEEDNFASDYSTFQHEDGSIWSISYPGCTEHVEELSEIISEYAFFDICRAVFCINSWYRNRSAQESTLSLNAALLRSESFGGRQIEKYEDLETLFERIKPFISVSPLEDIVIPVMGHTKIEFGESWHSVIYGCGMVQEYPRLCFAHVICAASNKEEQYRSLLDHVSFLCTSLDGAGWDGEAIERVEFCLPSKAHWECVEAWFSVMPTKLPQTEVIEALSRKSGPIEKIHFIQTDERVLPLFNPSILLDYLEECCNALQADSIDGIVDRYLSEFSYLAYSYNPFETEGCLEYPVFEIDGEYIDNCPCSFVICDRLGGVTLFYNKSFKNGNFKRLKRALTNSGHNIRIIETLERNGQHRVIEFKKPVSRINVIAYINNVKPISSPALSQFADEADMTCSALDVLSILHCSSSVEEISSFFESLKNKNNHPVLGISGLFPFFLIWKENHRNFLEGAEDRTTPFNIWCDFNDNDYYYTDFFRDLVVQDPFVDDRFVFGSPFFKQYQSNERGFVSMRAKNTAKHYGVSKCLHGKEAGYFVIGADSGSIQGCCEDEIEKEAESFNLIEDVFMCLVNSLEEQIADFAYSLSGAIRVVYVSENSSKTHDLQLIDNELEIRGFYSQDTLPTVFFTLNKERYFKALIESSNRQIECKLCSAVFSQFPDPNMLKERVIESIDGLSHQGKMVNMSALQLPYRWYRNVRNVNEDDVSKASAIKFIANSIDEADINPGTYSGPAANETIRSFQKELVPLYKDELDKYDAKELISGMMEICANALHDFYLHTRRFDSFGNLDENETKRVEDSALELREDCRARFRAARYCIETILGFGLGGTIESTKPDQAFLLSLSVQMVSINDMADLFLFNPLDVELEIEDNKIGRVKEGERYQGVLSALRKRQLRDPGHICDDESVDIRYIKLAKEAFSKDVGFSFECFIDVLEILATIEFEDALFVRKSPNVVEISGLDLEQFVHDQLSSYYHRSELERCVGYLVLDKTELTTIKGQSLDYLPFGQIKDRPNRLELRPLVMFDNTIIYSPVCAGILRERWIAGIAQRFLPAKTYSALYGVISHWKSHYEKILEADTAKAFTDHGFPSKHVRKGLYLHKNGSHPKTLGDYDVLAYDQSKETIWVIECKEYEKVESSFDYMQLQDRWFGSTDKLGKFERRITYIFEHKEEIASDLRFEHKGELDVKVYLVSNKIFLNMIGESSFQIISLNELNHLLDML